MAEPDLFDPLSPAFHADPCPFYRHLRETDPVHLEDCVTSWRDPRLGRDGFEARGCGWPTRRSSGGSRRPCEA